MYQLRPLGYRTRYACGAVLQSHRLLSPHWLARSILYRSVTERAHGHVNAAHDEMLHMFVCINVFVLAPVMQLGLGPRSSAIVAGYTHCHRQLEEELAQLKGTEDCLLFPTGEASCHPGRNFAEIR